jgi:putative DNA methylase
MADAAAGDLERIFADVPFGLPTEPIPLLTSRDGGGSAFT